MTLEADIKLVLTWLIGDRAAAHASVFIQDLADRIVNRIQLTTDGHRFYLEAVVGTFGAEIDYAMLIKLHGAPPSLSTATAPRSAPEPSPIGFRATPDPRYVSTSYIERQNLTMRMGMQSFTRLTNGFSKKAENLAAAVSLHFMHYNFARPHESLATPYPGTPAMARGVTEHPWSVEEIVALLK